MEIIVSHDFSNPHDKRWVGYRPNRSDENLGADENIKILTFPLLST